MNGGGERPGLAARRTAARLLAAIVDRRTPADALTDEKGGHPQFLALEVRDRALVRAILAAGLRHRVTLSKLLAERLERPLPQKARTLDHLLHVAMTQMLFLDVPSRAAIDLAVEHAGSDPRTRRFAGLVNAVLRAIDRMPASHIREVLDQTIDAPDWFADRLKSVYGEQRAREIFAAHRRPAPTDFTVKSDPEEWAERLGGTVVPTGSVRVEKPDRPIDELPGYDEGQWWVQDAAAALPARLLGDVAGLEVADLCAAPGGKTAQLASRGAMVTAVDVSASRMKRLAANLERLKLNVETVVCDVLSYEPESAFDAVLLDVPCSSTGTVRRHPDVPWTKTPDDIARLVELQRRLLARAVALVRPGGLIIYSNCSLDPAEGEDLIAGFLGQTGAVELAGVGGGEINGIDTFVSAAGTLRTTPADLQLGRPEISGMDGFFAARLRRIAA